MKKWWFFFICILGLGFFGITFYPNFRKEKPLPKSKHLKHTYGPYFFSIPVEKFTKSDIPCVKIKIENKELLVELDLGFRGASVFPKNVIETFSQKKLLGEDLTYGFRGKAYKKKKYQAPKIQLKDVTFSNAIMQEESAEFMENSYVIKDNTNVYRNNLKNREFDKEAPQNFQANAGGASDHCHRQGASEHENCEDKPTMSKTDSSGCFGINQDEYLGRIGWEFFRNCNLFLDLANSKIALCDSITSLNNNGYPLEDFAKIPLHIERGFIEMKIKSSKDTQFWTFDTGATWNAFNIESNRSFEELIADPKNILSLPLKIGDKDFGEIKFHKIPLPLPIHLDAMLGMEFFKTHQVFIDFAENQIYIRNSSKN